MQGKRTAPCEPQEEAHTERKGHLFSLAKPKFGENPLVKHEGKVGREEKQKREGMDGKVMNCNAEHTPSFLFLIILHFRLKM